MEWTRAPKNYEITEDAVTITTGPHTDLWQRTYYHFRNDNAPVLQAKTEDLYFSFIVKTEFDSKVRFDQSGIVVYLDSDNWIKASIEYENETIQRLGSVVTNNGYSDCASVDIDASVRSDAVSLVAVALEVMLNAVICRETEVICERIAEIEVDHRRRIHGSRLYYRDVIVFNHISIHVEERVIESDVLAALVVRDHDSVVCLVCADLVFHIPYPPEKCCT